MIRPFENSIYQLTYDVPLKVVPPVNGYLIMADKPILIDGGANDDDTFNAFQNDLESLGLKVSDLGAILVTHNHVDHIGLASRLAADFGRKVYVHEDEWPYVTATDEEREGYRKTLIGIFGFWGIPLEIIERIQNRLFKVLRLGGGIPRDQVLPYPKGKPLQVCGIELEAIHCPGHTDGLVCLWWEDKKTIFSNDEVLEDITPNPTLYLRTRNGSRCGLSDYLSSLANIEHLPVKTVMPGHGLPFSEMNERIGQIRASAQKRRDKILTRLKGQNRKAPSTIIELTQFVWGELDPISTFLASREMHGYLEMFMQEGIVAMEARDGVGYFKLIESNKFYSEKVI